MAAALGVLFLRNDGTDFVPTGGTLGEITYIDIFGLPKELTCVEIVAMCDVKAPLFGKTGAAYVFAPQKEASPEQVALLDMQLQHLHVAVEKTLGTGPRFDPFAPGAGAAGGMGYGAKVFLGATLKSGIDVVLDTVQFERQIQNADLIITGEGKLDCQSLQGKVIMGVAARSKPSGVPVVVIAGDVEDGIENVYDLGITAVFSSNHLAIPWNQAKERSAKDLTLTTENIMRLWNCRL